MKKRMLALSLAAAGLTALSALAAADPPTTLLAMTAQAAAKDAPMMTSPNATTLAAAPLATGIGLRTAFSTDKGGSGITSATNTYLASKVGTVAQGGAAMKTTDGNVLMAAAPPLGCSRQDLAAGTVILAGAQIGSA